MRVLIAYATREEQTRRIAEFMGARFGESGNPATVADVGERSPDPADFDAVIVAASIHVSRYEPAIERYVAAHREVLSRMHAAFVSVSLAAASPDGPENLARWDTAFQQKTGWVAPQIVHFAGALRYRAYNFVTRWIMRSIAKKAGLATDTSRDYEYTDWAAVKRFADSFASDSDRRARRPAVAG